MPAMSQSENSYISNYLVAGVKGGIQLGLFLYLSDIAVILWKETNILQLLSKDTLILEFIVSAIIYSFIGAFLGIILRLGIGVVQSFYSFGRNERIHSLYNGLMNGLFFSLITAVNIKYIWFPHISNNSFFFKLCLVLIVFLLALSHGYLVYHFERKAGSASPLKRLLNFASIRRMNPKFLLLVLLISVPGAILLASIKNKPPELSITGSKKITLPSIILIVVDTLRADHLSCLGHPNSLTPNIDSLAKDSVLFTNAYAQAPWTRPSVATLLTGLYPSSHGVSSGFKRKGNMDILSEDALTLTEYLKDRGYYTVGFSTNPSVTSDFGFTQGYNEYYFLDRLVTGRFSIHRWAIKIAGICLQSSFYVNAHKLTNKIFGWFKNDNTISPSFAYIHYMDPHRPYFYNPNSLLTITKTAYGQHLKKKNKESYLNTYKNEVAFVDIFVGELISFLKKIDVYNNSIIILTSDHGEEFLEHGGWDHGHTLYEELLRVPLIIKLPHSRKNNVDERLVSLMDLFPTILKTVGLAIPPHIQGVPLLSQDGTPLRNRPFVFSENLPSWKGQKAIRTRDWKLILSYDKNAPGNQKAELYYIREDPHETTDLSSSRKDLVKDFRSRIEEISVYAKSTAIYFEKGSVSTSVEEQLKALGYMQ
jgi:arylsulfatase A-like enzyme